MIPFITQRKGEEAGPANFYLLRARVGGELRLFYGDEDPRDRPLRNMLWARCSFSTDEDGLPIGEPVWKWMHPYRQMGTMFANRCQVCTRPARTPLGWIFLAGPKDQDPDSPLVWTNQPPVCTRHVRTTAKLCPHMEENPMVFLAESAPLHGVLGAVYDRGLGSSVDVVERPGEPVKFDDPRAPRVLASQLVRRLTSFRVLSVDELLDQLSRVEVPAQAG
ncbi:hypothetical protein ABZ568_00290 [Streptomyces olindensis]|uniref:Uncharacterized protein n=1 Tax=Streptomyces olindensis TaxID=358823 RepID=A0ABV2XLM9_9ACTN